jgi:probable rRNA maturation factor
VENIFNEVNATFDKEKLAQLINFLKAKMDKLDKEFNVIIVDNPYIHKINKEYRNIDKPTDVISFALNDSPDNDDILLGDIYISLDKVREQAKEYGHSELRELCFLTVHGFLHLLGYDHMEKADEEKMFKLQEELLNEFGIKR